jgi:hypothetical protein
VSAADCAAWVRGIYAARPHWTPAFDGVQFTLGRAWYTHLEEDRQHEYFAVAAESDALVEHFAPGLQQKMIALAASLAGAPVEKRPGWCGPGVHIFPAGEWLSENGGDVHFDTEGLLSDELAARRPALSLILMLQPPANGGGLSVWDYRYAGEDHVDDADQLPHRTFEYGVGDLVAIDSYRLHQIRPFTGNTDRISATVHAVETASGWRVWF